MERRRQQHVIWAMVWTAALLSGCGGGGSGGGDDPGGGPTIPEPPVPPTPPAAPTLTEVLPIAVPSPGLGVAFTLNGSGFNSTAVVQWNGIPVPTVTVNSFRVEALLDANLIGNSVGATLRVVTANGISGTRSVTLTAPCSTPSTPSISYIQWTGSGNGVVVKDATNDNLRFRADNLRLVVAGTTINNARVDGNGTFFLNDQPEGVVVGTTGTLGGLITVLVDNQGRAIDLYRNASCGFIRNFTAFVPPPAPLAAMMIGPETSGAEIPPLVLDLASVSMPPEARAAASVLILDEMVDEPPATGSDSSLESATAILYGNS